VKPAEEFELKQLIGKRVLFKEDETLHSCWHYQVGLKAGRVAEGGTIAGPESRSYRRHEAWSNMPAS
jgi:hypothetical protein